MAGYTRRSTPGKSRAPATWILPLTVIVLSVRSRSNRPRTITPLTRATRRLTRSPLRDTRWCTVTWLLPSGGLSLSSASRRTSRSAAPESACVSGRWRCPCGQKRERIQTLFSQLGQRQRWYNAKRAKILVFILRLQRRIISELLPDQVFNGRGEPVHVPVPPRTEGEDVDDSIVEKINSLKEDRPPAWDALHLITGLLVALARGRLVTTAQDGTKNHFWVAFHWAFLNAIRRGFCDLLRYAGADRPLLDWRLLAMLRSACLGVEGSEADPAEVAGLNSCYAAAVTQIRAFACGAWPPDRAGVKAKVDERFYRALARKLPIVGGCWGGSVENLDSTVNANASPKFDIVPKAREVGALKREARVIDVDSD